MNIDDNDIYLISQPSDDGVAAIKVISKESDNYLLIEEINIIKLPETWGLTYSKYNNPYIVHTINRFFIKKLTKEEWNKFERLYKVLTFLNIKNSTKNIRRQEQIKIKKGFYIKRYSFMNIISEDYFKVKLINGDFIIENIYNSKTDNNLRICIGYKGPISNIKTMQITSNINRRIWYKKAREYIISNLIINKLINI